MTGSRRAVRGLALAFLLLAGCGDAVGSAAERAGFDAPVAGAPTIDVFYGAYFDHGSPGEGVRDYRCGSKTYSGHRGVDILLRNFRDQDAGVEVLAAAPGTVTHVVDGMADRNTSWSQGGGFGNSVTVDHGNGRVAIYAHLRLGSIDVHVGQEVERGNPLGLIGSSGRSNWPHLHFEVFGPEGSLDPFAGPCGASAGLWAEQLPYQDAFGITDAGILDQPLGTGEAALAVLLERPETVRSIPGSTEWVVHWVQFANATPVPLRVEIVDPGGDVAAQHDYGAVGGFSMWYVTTSVRVDQVLTAPGDWTFRLHHGDEPVRADTLRVQAPVADAGAAAVPAGPAVIGETLVPSVPPR
jgi:murein DD-endopeptidase MepM/ murein hydrolase activator NlpD